MSKHTQKAIMSSFLLLLKEKSLDKITVKDVIETAEVNRNTFYYHYQDIYDLLEKTFEEELKRLENETPDDPTFYEEYVRIAGFFFENKEAINHIYNSRSREVLHRHIELAVGHFVSLFVKKAAEGTDLSEIGEEYITHFYTYAIIGSTLRWIEREMPDYKEGVFRTVTDSFESTIDIMIHRFIEGQKQFLH